MLKVSSKDAAALLKQAGAAIRTLSVKNQELETKLASQTRDARVVKIARDMEEKGLSPELDLTTKVAHLRKAENLDVTEEAVKLSAPQGLNLGELGETPGAAEHPFVSFIQTGDAS